jgi:integrase
MHTGTSFGVQREPMTKRSCRLQVKLSSSLRDFGEQKAQSCEKACLRQPPHSPNPVRDADLPKAKKGTTTHAHTLAEIQLMFAFLPEPAATIVAVAAYAGLRRSEIRGLRWEEYDGVALKVTRSVWEGCVGEPKTEASADDVPIIARLRERLEQHRQALTARLGRRPVSGWMFESEAGTPI